MPQGGRAVLFRGWEGVTLPGALLRNRTTIFPLLSATHSAMPPFARGKGTQAHAARWAPTVSVWPQLPVVGLCRGRQCAAIQQRARLPDGSTCSGSAYKMASATATFGRTRSRCLAATHGALKPPIGCCWPSPVSYNHFLSEGGGPVSGEGGGMPRFLRQSRHFDQAPRFFRL